MNILVTGGAGFIGSHTVDALIEKGHRVRILDNLHPTVHPKGKPDYIHPETEFIQGDVRDKDAWEKALDGIEVVYHFAAYQDYLTDFSTFFHVNAVSTALLYEILVSQTDRCSVKKVIVATSQSVMGEGKYKCPSCYEDSQQYIYPGIRLEDQLSKGEWNHRCPRCDRSLDWVPSDETVTQPCNQYALSKSSQEQIAIQLGKRYGIPTTAMRYSIVQGPRQSFYNAYSGAMRIFSLSLLLDKPPTIFEDGQQIRDYVNIEDVVSANLLVLDQDATNDQVFNVGSGQAWTVIDFYNTMQRVLGKKISPIIGNYYRYGDTRHIFSDISKLNALGWHPAKGIEESIHSYWQYISEQGGMTDVLEYAEKNMKKLNVIRKSRLSE